MTVRHALGGSWCLGLLLLVLAPILFADIGAGEVPAKPAPAQEQHETISGRRQAASVGMRHREEAWYEADEDDGQPPRVMY